MWEALWAYLDAPKGEFSQKEFNRRYEEYQKAEEVARKKLGEAMWAEPTNINSYDKCMAIDISVARRWIKTTVADHKAWRKKYGKKFDESQAWLKTISNGAVENSAPVTPTKGRTKATSGSTAKSSASVSKPPSKKAKSERIPKTQKTRRGGSR